MLPAPSIGTLMAVGATGGLLFGYNLGVCVTGGTSRMS